MASIPTAESHEVLARAEANLVGLRQLGFERLRIARDWAQLHRVAPEDVAANPFNARPLGASGLLVEEYAAAELAAALEVHPLVAQRLMADAVDLDARQPQVWAATSSGRIEPWVAREIVAATRDLSTEKALWVDAAVADLLGTLPPGRLLTVVEARVVEADQALADRRAAEAAQTRGVWLGRDNDHGTRPLFARGDAPDLARLYGTVDHLAHLLRAHCPQLIEETIDQLRARALCLLASPMAALKLMLGVDEHDPGDAAHDVSDAARDVSDAMAEAIRGASPEKLRPRTTCYVHVTPGTVGGDGVVRAEELGALTRQQLIDLLGHEQITLKPVIDLNDEIAADCYEVPAAVSEQLVLARPADCFSYAQSVSRKQDRDHTARYRWKGPPRQTRLSNLGHLVRRHHRIKTHAGWKVSQHRGRFTWITPHGRVYVTGARGTHRAVITPYVSPLERRVAELVLAS